MRNLRMLALVCSGAVAGLLGVGLAIVGTASVTELPPEPAPFIRGESPWKPVGPILPAHRFWPPKVIHQPAPVPPELAEALRIMGDPELRSNAIAEAIREIPLVTNVPSWWAGVERSQITNGLAFDLDFDLDFVIEALELAAEFVRDPSGAVAVHPVYYDDATQLRRMADRLDRQKVAARKIREAIERLKREKGLGEERNRRRF